MNYSVDSSLDMPQEDNTNISTQEDNTNISIAMEGSYCGTTYEYTDITQNSAVRVVFVVVYIAIMILSVAGNMLVIYTIWKHRHMRTVTNMYLANLATADILVAIVVLPLKLVEYTSPCEWPTFRLNIICSLLAFFLPVFVFASVLTLMAISIERYYAVVYPLNAMKVQSMSRTRKIIAVTWLSAVLLASPYLFGKSYEFSISSELGSISRRICTDRFEDIDTFLFGAEHGQSGWFRRVFFLFLFVTVYLLPLIIIISTCARIVISLLQTPMHLMEDTQRTRQLSNQRREENKRKVARMVIVVAASFLLCWSPFYLVTLISQLQENSFLNKSNFICIMLSIHLSGFLNSCVNPFIYNCMSNQFRNSFRTILSHICCPCRPNKFAANHKFHMPSDFTNTTVVKAMPPGNKTHEYILTDDMLSGSHKFYKKRSQKNGISEL